MKSIEQFIAEKFIRGSHSLAVLIDPDELGREEYYLSLIQTINNGAVDIVFVGGSLLTGEGFEKNLARLKADSQLPLILFPGSSIQLTKSVDALLFLSLISGRNPELLIGQHVIAAPRIAELGIKTIATGYMLIDGGKPTTASYISNTQPIPRDKPSIAAATAMAGEMLGLQCLYLDGGSGALFPVPIDTIKAVRKTTQIPMIVGGGIRSTHDADAAFRAGADIVVIGTLFEEQPELLAEFRSELRGSDRKS